MKTKQYTQEIVIPDSVTYSLDITETINERTGITLFKKVCNDVDSYYYTDGGKETIIKKKMYNTLLKLI